MIALVVLGSWVAGVVVGGYFFFQVGKTAGNRQGKAEMDRDLAENPGYREVVLTRLAKMHGAKVSVNEVGP